jgi:hypothetical protein
LRRNIGNEQWRKGVLFCENNEGVSVSISYVRYQEWNVLQLLIVLMARIPQQEQQKTLPYILSFVPRPPITPSAIFSMAGAAPAAP